MAGPSSASSYLIRKAPREGEASSILRRVPELDGPIVARRREQLAVRGERDRAEARLVRLGRIPLPPGRHVPDPEPARPGPDQEVLAIGRESQGVDSPAEAVE